MSDFIFPFPNRELALQELNCDPCYAKIKEKDKSRIVEEAWETGRKAALSVWAEFGGERDFFQIAERSRLTCRHIDTDYVVGARRYFSDYLSGQNQINFYTKSIALWAKENGFTQEQAEALILSHEYFHFLEWNRLGLTSRLYRVPMLQIGKLKIGSTGIRALSEIGAHAFARTYYELENKEESADDKKTEL